MTLKTAMLNDISCFFNVDEFGQDVLYNDGDGPVAVVGVVDIPHNDPAAHQATIMVKKSQVLSPEYRHTFIIDGVTWLVSSGKDKNFILGEDEHCFVLSIRRNERFSQWQK